MWIWIQEVRFPGCWLGLGIEGEQQQLKELVGKIFIFSHYH